jgi:hypothetical protein
MYNSFQLLKPHNDLRTRIQGNFPVQWHLHKDVQSRFARTHLHREHFPLHEQLINS